MRLEIAAIRAAVSSLAPVVIREVVHVALSPGKSQERQEVLEVFSSPSCEHERACKSKPACGSFGWSPLRGSLLWGLDSLVESLNEGRARGSSSLMLLREIAWLADRERALGNDGRWLAATGRGFE